MHDDMSQDPASKAFVPVCAIGASAGGVTALQELLRQLPTDLGLAYVVIIHLSPDQPSALSQILSACTRMPVWQVDDGPTLKPNCVYVIPPDRELVIEGDSVTARTFTEPRGQRATIDMFFRSIAAARGDGIAVVLSGAGADGAAGVRAVKEAGGVIMVQEPAEAHFPSMPQNAIASGVADFVAPLARLAERLAEVARSKEAVRSLDMEGGANDLRRIVAFLRARTGHDFSGYKRATVMRRVLRRMQVCRADTLAAYADHLLTTPEETKELFSDLLISVTAFFRDAMAYAALERHAVKAIFDDIGPGGEEGIRAWVVGCATGEEAYSLAILFHEEAARRKLHPQVQIFATDLDEGALATAREGRYPRAIEADIAEDRLARFFVDEGTHYRVRKEIRESVLFATHSAIKEPPFLRLDLISCRNLLIYLERALQQQLCAIFRYGLKSGRYLFLGSAETADVAADLFAPVDREARIYSARPHAAQTLPVLPQFATPERLTGTNLPARLRAERADLPAALHVAALERIAPASALVDDEQNVIHLSSSAGRFLLLSAGPVPTLLPSMVRPELRLDLRLALTRAIEANESTLTLPVVAVVEGERRRVSMHVTPVPGEDHAGVQVLVFFLDGGGIPAGEAAETGAGTQPGETRRLHTELKAAQEALVSSRIGHEATVQDLRATNEELQSTNEEYRSTAEELETSKEELQSINEELHTVNAELKSKLASISVAHSDLQNLTTATDIGTLFLDADLRIKMFTPPVAELFNITRADIGRAVTDFTHRLEYDGIAEDARRIQSNPAPLERELRSKGGRWYVVRLRPYRTVEDRIDGAVVSFVDITAGREAEAARRDSEVRFRAFVTASSDAVYRMSPDWSNMHHLDGHGFLADLAEPNESWMERYIQPDDRAVVQKTIDDAIRARSMFELEHRVRRADGTVGWALSRAVPVLDEQDRIAEWLGAAKDVTIRRQAEDALRQNQERQTFLLGLSDALRPLAEAAAIQGEACSLLAEHLEVDRAYYVEVDAARGIATVDRDYVRDGASSLAGQHPVASFSWSVDILRTGACHVVADTQDSPSVPPDSRAALAALEIMACMGAPLIKAGTLVGALCVTGSRPRVWAEAEVELLREVGERIWSAVERARAEAALRESEARHRAELEGQVRARTAELQTSHDLLQATMDSSIDMIQVFEAVRDQSGEIVDFRWLLNNHASESQIGNVVGQSLLAHHPGVIQEGIFETFKRVTETGEQDQAERHYVHEQFDGWFLQSAVKLGDGVATTTKEISAWKTAQEELLRLRDAVAQAKLRESEERLRQFGEASSDVLWIRDAETLRWEYLTPAFEAIYGLSRSEALSGDNYRNWVDLIVPEDRQRAVSSIQRVREGERITFEYRIRRPVDGEIRWLRNTDFPMRDPDGRVVRIGGVGHDITEMKAIEAALTHSEHRLRTLVEGVAQLVWRAVDNGDWTWASPQWTAFTGQSGPDSHHLGWLEPIHPDDRDIAHTTWDGALESGAFEVEYRIRNASTGEYRWFQTRVAPVRDQEGSITEWLGTSTDIHDLRELQARQHVLVAELQHRTRNLLTVVRNIARRSIPTSSERDEYDARLAALGRVQGFLSRTPGYSVPLADVVEAELQATGNGASEKVEVGGPLVELPGESVQAVALVLHELATNAVKYGAIGQTAGRLAVTWRVEPSHDGTPHLTIDWCESRVAIPDGPPVRQGYGTELITKALPYQLKATTKLEFRPDGVRCRISLPASAFNLRNGGAIA